MRLFRIRGYLLTAIEKMRPEEYQSFLIASYYALLALAALGLVACFGTHLIQDQWRVSHLH